MRLAIFLSLGASLLSAATPCDELSGLSLPQATVDSARTVASGAFTPTDLSPDLAARLPAFCRVALTLRPSDDSDIKAEVWMPASGWNGKFMAVGNGGWSGNIAYAALAQALVRGYATASTDTGHKGQTASFALGHPQKLIDFAYRAVHETAVQSKAVIAAFYGSSAKLSYWNGCSSGGKQGLKEAQKYPADFNGIIAGAPANYWTHLMTGDLWAGIATLKDPQSYIPKEKYALIHKAVLEACDARDGVKDGVIEDPSRCRFDPGVLLCSGGDAPDCLTAAQVDAARKIYSGPPGVFPGLAPGSELGWGALAGGPKPFAIVDSHFKYVVFRDPDWDFRTLDLSKDVALADKIDGGLLNATDPNLKPFTRSGGKLLIYHGWNDQLIAPQNSIDYYRSVVTAMGGNRSADESVRLFMAPGMNHCFGGDGPSAVDWVAAMEQWVEQGKAPDALIGAHLSGGKPDRTRPICMYPKVAKYAGSGDLNDAANFTCVAPRM